MKQLDKKTREQVRALAISFEAFYDYRMKRDYLAAARWGDRVLRHQEALGIPMLMPSTVRLMHKLAKREAA